MNRLQKNPEACQHAESTVIQDLIYGWGNASWSAGEEYLAECVRQALTLRGPILECGSGLSTIVIGSIAKQRGARHWALEHTPEWAERVQRYLNRYKLDSVVLCPTPLKDYGSYSWYDAPADAARERFSLIICDGPPGDTKGGRHGLAPIMKERIERACVILLDDAAREGERTVAGRWATELGATIETLGSQKPYIRLTVIGSAA